MFQLKLDCFNENLQALSQSISNQFESESESESNSTMN